MYFNSPRMLRIFDVSIATSRHKANHRVIAANAMAAYRWALQEHGRDGQGLSAPLRSLVIKPAQVF